MATDGLHGNPDHTGRLLGSQAAEEAHLDQLRLSGVVLLQRFEGFIQRHDHVGPLLDKTGHLIDRHWTHTASALGGRPPPGVIHQDLPHHLRRYAVEVRPGLIIGLILAYQPHVGLMNQGRRLQGMPAPFAPQVGIRHPS